MTCRADKESNCTIRLDNDLPCHNCVYYESCKKEDFKMKRWYKERKEKLKHDVG